MKNKFYQFKDGVIWRKEQGSLLFLHSQEKRLLIFNSDIANNISDSGLIKTSSTSLNFINFLNETKAIEEASPDLNWIFPTESLTIISAPLNVTIQITNKCNLNCVHCHNDKEQILETMPMEKFKKLIDELSFLKVFNINISGGEPLLIEDIINMVNYVTSCGMSCTMSTNLTLLNEDNCIKLARAGLKKVHISLDSFDSAIHNRIRGVANSFERMIGNLHLLKENGIQYTMVTTLVDQTPEYYAKTIDAAFNLGASAHKTNTVVPQGKSKTLDIGYYNNGEHHINEYIDIWKNKKKEFIGKMVVLAETMFLIQMGEIDEGDDVPEILRVGCPAGILTCAINEFGDVMPCSFFTGLTLGNIFNHKFADIWNSDEMLNFRDRKKIVVCGSCKYCDRCGGCRARAFGQTGELNREDQHCFLNIKKN